MPDPKSRKILPGENEEDYNKLMEFVDEKDKLLEYEHFRLERLGYNPTKHILVPKHIPLSTRSPSLLIKISGLHVDLQKIKS